MNKDKLGKYLPYIAAIVLFAALSLIGFEMYGMISNGAFSPLNIVIVLIFFAVIEQHHKEKLYLDSHQYNHL